MVWAAACLLLVGACSSPSPQTPAATLPPSPTDTAIPAQTPVLTQANPALYSLTLNESFEAHYNPHQATDQYVFECDRAQRIGINLEAVDGGGPLQLAVAVYDSSGTLIPLAAESVGQPLLRHEWDLPAAGRYTIRVFGPEMRRRTFSLVVFNRPTPSTGGGQIAYGETHSGEIAVRGQRDQWVFWGRAGDQVRIQMVSFKSDAYLEVYAPDGRLIGRNDDATQMGQNSVLELTLPADGEYGIVARMYDDDQTGAYQLALEVITESR